MPSGADGNAVARGSNVGTTQLILLGQWLEARLRFWSLGHCYSPSMDYKRRLGHRVLPRHAFLQKLRRHRGAFATVAKDDQDTGRSGGTGAATASAVDSWESGGSELNPKFLPLRDNDQFDLLVG